MRAETHPRWLQVAAVLAAAAAAVATSPAWVVDSPAWQIDRDREEESGGLSIRAWVSKSGREGMGVTLRVENRGQEEITLRITKAAFLYEGASIPSRAMPPTATVGPEETHHVYLPFLFENHALTAGEISHGRLEITFRAGDAGERVWTLSMSYRMRKLDARSGLTKPSVDAAERSVDGGTVPDGGLSGAGSQ